MKNKDKPKYHLSFVQCGMGEENNPYTASTCIMVPFELFDGPINKKNLWSINEIDKVNSLLGKYNYELVTDDAWEAHGELCRVADKIKKEVSLEKFKRHEAAEKRAAKAMVKDMKIVMIDFSKP